jgi:hypothetical protein
VHGAKMGEMRNACKKFCRNTDGKEILGEMSGTILKKKELKEAELSRRTGFV